jgi:hypothetical protein
MSRIFLSHSSKDNFEAIALRGWLASEGLNDVFLDLDPERGIAAGERWEQALHAAANRCEAVIFLISGNWLESGWCLKEYALARGLNKKLFAALGDSPYEMVVDTGCSWPMVLPLRVADRLVSRGDAIEAGLANVTLADGAVESDRRVILIKNATVAGRVIGATWRLS